MALALALPFIGLGEIVAMTGTAALGVAEFLGVAASIELAAGLVGAASGAAGIAGAGAVAGAVAAAAGTGAATGAGAATAATAAAATAGGVALAPVAAVVALFGAGYVIVSQATGSTAEPGMAANLSPTTESQSQPGETAANSSETAIPSPASPTRGPDDDGNQVSDNDSDQHHPRLKKPIFIPKSIIEDLLNTHGRSMHRKLKRLTPDYQGTIWKNQDFRIDAGSTLHGRPNFKTWNLQVNRHPMSDAAKALKNKFGTHKKLLWGAFDVTKAPKYATWAERILELFDR